MSLRKRPLTSSYGALSEHGPWGRCGQSFAFFRHQKTHIFSDVPAAFHWLLMLRTELLDQRFTQIVIRCKSTWNTNDNSSPKLPELEEWIVVCISTHAERAMTICVKNSADLRQTGSRMSWKSCYWNIRKWDFLLKDSKMQMTWAGVAPWSLCEL